MLEVADRLFAERGYRGASMEEIAAGVGVTKPMLYAYFGSKQGLYLACLQRSGELLMERLLAVDASQSGEQRLRAGIEAFFSFVDEHREGWRVLFREAASGGGPVEARVAELRGQIAQAVEQALRGGAPLAHAIVGAGEALANWWLEHPEEPRELMAERLWTLAAPAFAREE